MHNYNIALALADARVADLQRAATRTLATVPPRRQGRYRRALAVGLAGIAVFAAGAPTDALAQPAHDVQVLAKTSSRPQVVVAQAVPQTRPAPTSGFDWVDAGIGAGLTAALLVGAAGVASVRRRPTIPAH